MACRSTAPYKLKRERSLALPAMEHDFRADIDAVESIAAVPAILNVVCRVTGMGFAAVARVTPERWVCLAVNDEISFGLKPGGELKVDTTICHEVRQAREAVVIDHVAEDELFCRHHTPAMYGFQSYISMPIFLADGSFFGTLCAIDPRPAKLKNPGIIGMFRLFADLIAHHLDAGKRLATAEASLLDARAQAELREQFIAVLSHDLRNPLASIAAGTRLIERTPLNEKAQSIAAMMHQSVARMSVLIDNVMDFARGQLGGGIALKRTDRPLEPALRHVVDELRTANPNRTIEATFDIAHAPHADPDRIARLLSKSCRQCARLWCEGGARTHRGQHRSKRLRAFRPQYRAGHSSRHDAAVVSAIRPR